MSNPTASPATAQKIGLKAPAATKDIAPVTIPLLDNYPAVKAAAVNLARLTLECHRIESRILDNREAQIEEQRGRKDRALMILRGETPDAVKPLLEENAALSRLLRDTEAARQMAAGELAEARRKARLDAVGKVRDSERAIVRKAVVKLIEAALAMQEMLDFHDGLMDGDLLSLFVRPLPAQLPWGMPADPTSFFNQILGELVVTGYLDLAADAALLAGCHPVIPRPFVPEPEPTRKPKDNGPGAMTRALRSLGVAFPSGVAGSKE